MMGTFNTKYGGGGINLCPYSVVNDGMIELILLTSKAGFCSLVTLMDEAHKMQGIHSYREDLKIYRGKTFKIVNMNEPDSYSGEKAIQRYSVDGEDLFFRDFVKQ